MIANNRRLTMLCRERGQGVAVAEIDRFTDFNAPLCSWTSSMTDCRAMFALDGGRPALSR